jgi:hypothetical protein
LINALTAATARHHDHDDSTNTWDKTGVVSSRRRGRRLVAAVLMAVGVAASGACATTKAATPRERPALDVPPPPPRIVVPLPPPQAPLEPVESLPPAGASTPPRPRVTREKETVKPDPKPEEQKPVEAPPAPVQPPPTLRMPETENSAQLAAQISESIARSAAIREKIDYGPLSNLAKKAYDDSKIFGQQAEEALKANNLAFAKELADKAERLAQSLQGRR